MFRQQFAQKSLQEKNWYVIYTYSGHEEVVVKNLKQRIESFGMEDKIFNVIVPREKKIKIKDGKRKTIEEKIYLGYILVEMIITHDSWYVVRNTPRVTGFVGAGTIPIPVTPEEIKALQKKIEKKEPQFKIDVRIGDLVKITDGPFKDFDGKISELDEERGKVKVLINMFGRDTAVELDSLQVKKI